VRNAGLDLIGSARPIAPVGAAASSRLAPVRSLETSAFEGADRGAGQGPWPASTASRGGMLALGQAAGTATAAGAPTVIQGDVMLDGAAVGRWVSRALTRELRRPDAGPTGVDGRRDPVLPGIAVGG
jgi:hypothetical protein